VETEDRTSADDAEQYAPGMPDGARVLRLEGELDAFHAPDVRKRLHELIDELDGGGVLVVDLTAVSFLDSTILGTLVGGLRRMREGGGELRLVYPAPPADRIFQLTGLDAVFPAA
jgi:anti-sigma B factor antagonist